MFPHSKVTGSSPVHSTLEITIKDFRTANESTTKDKYTRHCDQQFSVLFSVSTFCNGCNEDTEGWLLVRPDVNFIGSHTPKNSLISWVVSVIDVEGNARFPRSFKQDLSTKHSDDVRYLERSLILARADEFLPEGVLTLRCDICFEWQNLVPISYHDNVRLMAEIFFSPAAKRALELARNDPETRHLTSPLSSIDTENKTWVLSSVYRAESGEVLGIYDTSLSPESEESNDPRVWKFETRNKSFNVVLDEELDGLGSRLLKASPVIRQCANAPMKERRERRIEFPDVNGQTFIHVCYFLSNAKLPKFEFDQLLDVYKFSHLYEMEDLRRKCAEHMMTSLELESDFKELEKIAAFYSDEYLSELLRIRRHEKENLEMDLPNLRMDDKPYSDSYI